MDTLSATVADDAFPNGLLNPLFFDQRSTRGLSDFDVRQIFASNFTWELPAPAVMARTVALWRCKCGTRAKVMAEAGSSPSAEQIVLCPKCRAPHAVHADKIISVTEETFERSPAAPCNEKVQLLVALDKAFNTYKRFREIGGDSVAIGAFRIPAASTFR